MSLSTRIALILCGVVLLYGVLAMLIQNRVVAPGFASLERDEAAEDMERVLGALQREVDHLDTFCHDWSAWDDTYAYVENKNEAFEKSNLSDSTFTDYFLNLIFIVNPGGEVVWGKVMDYKARKSLEMEEFPVTHWAVTHPLLQHLGAHDKHNGILVTHSGPVLVAARPIVNSESNGPIRGTLVMGRILDEEGVRRIAEQARVGVSIEVVRQGVDGTPLSKDSADGHRYQYREANQRTLMISCTVPDMLGQSGLLVKVSIVRDIMARGHEVLRSSRIFFFVSGLLTLVVVLFLVRRSVVKPLRQLTAHVTRVSKEEDFTPLPVSARGDEIGVLTREFNGMVDRIRRHAEERGRTETALRESETRIRTILDTAPDGILTLSAEGVVESFNPAAEQLFGCAGAEAQGRPLREFIPDLARGNEDAPLPPSGVELLGKRRDGSLFPLHWSVSATPLAGSELYTGIVRDISELKAMHQKMHHAEHLAMLGEMGASMAHEIRNPLAGISGAVQVFKSSLAEDDPRRETLDEVITQVGRVEALVRRLLMLSRPWTPKKEAVNLVQLVERVTHQARAREAYAGILFEIEERGGLEAMADPGLMELVLWNVLNNASEAMRGQPRAGEALWSFQTEEDRLRVRLRDNGCGMTEAVREQIFHPFFTTKADGTGLGLLICRRIVEAHGGAISIASEEGRGTEVTIELPKGY